jgi:hypothetical protein
MTREDFSITSCLGGDIKPQWDYFDRQRAAIAGAGLALKLARGAQRLDSSRFAK